MITLTPAQLTVLAQLAEAHSLDVHIERVRDLHYGTMSVRCRGHQADLTLYSDGMLVSPSGYQLDPTNLIYDLAAQSERANRPTDLERLTLENASASL